MTRFLPRCAVAEIWRSTMSRCSDPPPLKIALGFAILCAIWAGAGGTEDPPPTPTPAPSATATASTTSPTKRPIVITDENLQEYAQQGSLTTASPGAAPSAGRPVHVAGTADEPGLPPVQAPMDDSEAEKQRYWRELYRRQINVIESLRTEIEQLDIAIPGLWNKFYAWDDPAYRDSVIKPELDQSLARREHLERQLEEERTKLPKIMDDARRDGASPGWFRDLPRPSEVLAGGSAQKK